MRSMKYSVRPMSTAGALLLLALLPSACSDEDDGRTAANSAALCDDGNPCTLDLLGAAGCRHSLVSAGTRCTEASFCGAPGACNSAGVCVATAPICGDGIDCTMDVCLGAGGVWGCTHPNKPSGTSCSDSNVCTSGDACNSSGSCVGRSASINDSNPCTTDTCDPTKGVSHTAVANGTACSDGDLCNGAETCTSGVCQSGSPPALNDNNPCTTDSCQPTTGVVHRPIPDGVSCADGDACNGIETCRSGVCRSGPPLDCDDNSACTSDSCDDLLGCQHAPVKCTDGDLCTADSCNPSTGCVFIRRSCEDGNACTQNQCDAHTGECYYPAWVNAPCNDADMCTVDDRCDAAGSCGGEPLEVEDADPCTVDSCDAMTGVAHNPAEAGTPCSNGEFCDESAQCVGLPQSESVVAQVGGQDPAVRERLLGRGRHPVTASEDGLAVAFYEVLESGDGRAGVATFSPVGQGRGLWYVPTAVVEPDPVVAALPDGGFVVAYEDLFVDGDGLGVVLVRLSAQGEQVSSMQLANQTTEYGQHGPDLVWQGDRLWVSWRDDSVIPSQGGPRSCVRAFTESLVAMGSEACDAVDGQTLGAVSLAVANGGLARAWLQEGSGSGSVEVSWKGNVWSLALAALPPDGELPVLAALDGSHLLLAYTDGQGDQKVAVLRDGDGDVAPVVMNPLPMPGRFEPSLAMTLDGVFLAWREEADSSVGWTQELEDIYVQRFEYGGGTLSVGEVWWLPNEGGHNLGDQRRPGLASAPVTPSGALWAAWNDLGSGLEGPVHGDVKVSLIPTPIERPAIDDHVGGER